MGYLPYQLVQDFFHQQYKWFLYGQMGDYYVLSLYPTFKWDFGKNSILIGGGNSNGLENVHPDFGGNDPI